MTYTFALAAGSGGAVFAETATARSRSLTWRLVGANQAAFVLDGRGTEAALITELEDDLVVLHSAIAEPVFRGRIGMVQDTISPDVHTVSYTCLDYSEILRRRLVLEGDSLLHLNTAQDTIAWNLIQDTQARTNGSLGITRGETPGSPYLRTRRYEAGQIIGQLIDQLAAVDNGFEWDIDGLLQFNVWQPTRGTAGGLVLDLGGTVAGLSRTKNPSGFSNVVRQTGDAALTAVTATSATIATDPRGRWEANYANSDLKEQTTVADRAAWQLDQVARDPVAWSLALTQGWWYPFMPGAYLGDTATLVVDSGRLDEVVTVRITEIALRLGESGEEDVQMTVEVVA
jgi:hypothetical protein